jgi:hypothetical protein
VSVDLRTSLAVVSSLPAMAAEDFCRDLFHADQDVGHLRLAALFFIAGLRQEALSTKLLSFDECSARQDSTQ